MSFYAPFDGVDFAQWTQDLREAGFSPAQGMKLYDEIRLFGHGACRPDPVSDADRAWDEIRTRHCDRLLAVRTPKDFEQYVADCAILVAGAGADRTQKQDLLNAWMRQGNDRRIERGQMIQRVSGQFAFRQPEQWDAWDELGLEWEDVEAAMRHDQLNQPRLQQVQQGSSMAQAETALANAVNDSGLQGLEWGANAGHGADFLQSLAHNTNEANAALRKRTGWAGGVLGIQKRVLLRMAVDVIEVSGNCTHADDEGVCHINAGARAGWGVVAHEWLHGLDFAMGRDVDPKAYECASEMSGHALSGHWQQMLAAMTGQRFGENQSQAVVAELNDGFKRRWSSSTLPPGLLETIEAIFVEREAGATDPESRKAQHLRLQEAYGRDPQRSLLGLHAEIAMTELELLTDQKALLAEGRSIWVQFAERFGENIRKHHPKLQEEWDTYFLRPCEQAAHSFESTFGSEGSLITDVDPETSSLRYPLPTEAMSQTLAWRRLFKETSSWWQAQQPSALPDQEGPTATAGLAARLGVRRNANRGTSPDMAIAASP